MAEIFEFDEPREFDDTDLLILAFGRLLEETKKIPKKINQKRYEEYTKCFGEVKDVIDGEDMEITGQFDEEYRLSAYISIKGTRLHIRDAEKFRKICEIASLYNAGRAADGKVSLEFVFNGMAEVVRR